MERETATSANKKNVEHSSRCSSINQRADGASSATAAARVAVLHRPEMVTVRASISQSRRVVLALVQRVEQRIGAALLGEALRTALGGGRLGVAIDRRGRARGADQRTGTAAPETQHRNHNSANKTPRGSSRQCLPQRSLKSDQLDNHAGRMRRRAMTMIHTDYRPVCSAA